MMELLRKNGPLILVGLAVLIFLAFAAYSYFRSDDDDYEDDDDVEGGSTLKMSGSHAADTQELLETDDMRARKSRMIALKDSLEKSLQTRAGVKASGMDRLAMPWFMLVGTEGSGKRSLLASTGLPLPYGPPVEVDSAKKDAGRWWLFEEAVVVEAPTAKPVPKAVAPSEVTAAEPAIQLDTSEGWNNLLHLLRRERPDSPLNGIIVTVSCADLVGTRRKNPEEVAAQAELIRAFLEKTRRVLGVRLPVHLLITKCDVLPGFRSFAETLPEARRDDIFGWANPNPLEKLFDSSWVNNGFATLQKSLEGLHDELLAAPETIHDADGLFVFVNEFAEIQDPLVEFVTKLMPAGERRPSLFLRGVFFTGDASEMAAKAASRRDEDATTMHISLDATEAESHSLVFLRSLFADKIFREAGLARTAARLRISRDVRVVVAQAAALFIAILGGAGLWTSLYGFEMACAASPDAAASCPTGTKVYRTGLTADASSLTRLLEGVAIDLDELKRRGPPTGPDSALERRTKDATVISLVNEMRNVTAGRIRSLFVPSSWFSPLPSEIKKSVAEGVQTLLLPITRLRLRERADRLLGSNGRAGVTAADDLDPADPKSLATYLGDVSALNRNIARYNALASPDSGTATELAVLVDYLFGERLSDSSAASSEFEDALRVAFAPSLAITPAQTNAVVSRAVSLVAAVADSAAQQLTGRAPLSRADDDLRALRRLHGLAGLTDPKTGLSATIADSTANGKRVAKAVQDSIGIRFGLVASRVLRDTLPPDQAAPRLRSILSGMFGMRLMEPIEGRVIEEDLRAGQTLRWDIGQLELAFALRGELRRAQISASDAFSTATQARLRSEFDSQMRARVIDLVASAQRFTPDTVNAMTEIRAATENLDAASARILRLALLLDSLKAGGEGRKLIAVGARQAEHVLALAQIVLDDAKYLAPHPTVVVAWRGGTPIGFAALGVADTGSFNLRLDREQIPPIQALAAAVVPALNFLKQSAVTTSMISSPKLLADWRGIVAAAGPEPTTNTLASLHEFIQTTMGPIDQPSCMTAANRPDTLKANQDWFVMRRRQFRAALVGRCGATGSADAIAAYQQVRAVFVSKLAGHFPFVDSAKAAAAPDADPAAVREFFQLYDAFAKSGDVSLRSDPRVGPGARLAFTFLDQVAQVRPFFAPFVDSGSTRRAPEYAFVVEPWKPAVAGTVGELHTGVRVVAVDDSTHDGVWGFGEAVKTVEASGEPAAKPMFTSTGWWSLIELGVLQHDVKIRYYHPDTKVLLKLPIFPTVAPDIPIRGR